MPDINDLKAVLTNLEASREKLNHALALAGEAGLPEKDSRALDEAIALLRPTISRLVAETFNPATKRPIAAPPLATFNLKRRTRRDD